MWLLSVLAVYLGLSILVAIKEVFFIFAPVFLVAIIIPGCAVFIRRLHDTNRSGWWWLVSFIPLVGGIVLLVFLATPGDQGDNDFGPAPQ
jgi:uncharacterized membrane protein YhaH (DUF805 family)